MILFLPLDEDLTRVKSHLPYKESVAICDREGAKKATPGKLPHWFDEFYAKRFRKLQMPCKKNWENRFIEHYLPKEVNKGNKREGKSRGNTRRDFARAQQLSRLSL